MSFNNYGNYPNWNPYQNNGVYSGNQYNQQQGNPQIPQSSQAVSMKADWAQGEAAARAYPCSPGMLTLLMDNETPTLYVKQTDPSGRPYPLEVYDLVKRESYPAQNQQMLPMYSQANHQVEPDMSAYVKRDELESEVSEIVRRAMLNNGGAVQ